MPRSFFSIFVALLFLSSCGHTTSISDEGNAPAPVQNTSSPITSVSDASSPPALGVVSVSMGRESPLIVEANHSVQLGLDVLLSDERKIKNAYRGVDDFPDSILWFSQNSSVTMISQSGNLQALTTGQTTIRASMLNQSAFLDVIVVPEIVSLTQLIFHQNAINIVGPNNFQTTLDAVFSNGSLATNSFPDSLRSSLLCDLHFSSSNTNIAVVTQSGLITPLANGSVRISVECGLISHFISVNISGISPTQTMPAPEALQSITLLSDATPWLVGETKTLSCDLQFDSGLVHAVSNDFVTPLGNRGILSWSSSDASLVSIQQGIATLRGYGSVTITASFQGLSSHLQKFIKMQRTTPNPSSGAFVGSDDVATITYGINSGYGANLFPNIIYGPPRINGTNVVSLGGGGKILIGFRGYRPVDGPGPDFTIFENPIFDSSYYGLFAERAQVSVSQDGVHFYTYPCNAFDSRHIYAGCSGTHVVNATANPLDPNVSGGDSYDLEETGFGSVRFIKIQDRNTCVPGDPTYMASATDGSPLCTTSGEQGFDLDAISIINGN